MDLYPAGAMTHISYADESAANAVGHLQPQNDHRLAVLENERAKLVQTVLDIRTRCEQAEDAAGREQAQRLLSAAVEDLERHDGVLEQVRTGGNN